MPPNRSEFEKRKRHRLRLVAVGSVFPLKEFPMSNVSVSCSWHTWTCCAIQKLSKPANALPPRALCVRAVQEIKSG